MVIIAEESELNIRDVDKQQTTSDFDFSAADSKTKQTDGEEEGREGANVSGGVHGDEDAAASSDGFETASEHEVSDRDNDDDDDDRNVSKQPQQASDSVQNDDDLKQKALAEANDAKVQGNKLFSEGQYEEALLQYEHALQVVPDMSESTEIRSICHSNRGVCFFKLGKYEDTIKECTKALELNPTYMKALTRRGEAHEKLEHFEEAIAGKHGFKNPFDVIKCGSIKTKDMKKILELDASNEQAKKSIRRLEPLAAEKREKMKEELIGKLKEMGNSLLGHFGMSVDNFKAVKDPNTGSYSVSFQQ